MKHLYVDTDIASPGDGTSWAQAKASLASAIAALPADLRTDDSYTIHCRGTAADTTAADIVGHETDATHTITVTCDAGDRHSGVWNTSKYRLEGISIADSGLLAINENNVTVDGLQVYLTTDRNADTAGGIGAYTGTAFANATITIKNNIVRAGPRTYSNDWYVGISLGYANWSGTNVIRCYNNVVYDFAGANAEGIDFDSAAMGGGTIHAYVYNNTVYNCNDGVRPWTVTAFVAKDNISVACGNKCYDGTFDATSTHNLSSDQTAPAINTYWRGATVNFLAPTATPRDLRLASNDSAAINVGADLHEDANCPFSTDIAGQDRPNNAWDLGAYEFTGHVGKVSYFPLAFRE